MLDIMVVENSTQHGGDPRSQRDSVLASAKFLSYCVFLSETVEETSGIPEVFRALWKDDQAYAIYKGWN